MSLTALQLLTEIAAAEAKTWDATIASSEPVITPARSDLAEPEKFHVVTKATEALLWWWKEHQSNWAWPETVDSNATVAVTDGLIALSDLGDGSGCSLWTADPRPWGNSAQPLECSLSEDGVHPETTLTSVFAFYRTTCPEITYAAGGLYATPANIPKVCLRPVVRYANGWRLRSQGQFKEGNAQIDAAIERFEERRVRLTNLGAPVWKRNWFTIE